MRKLLKLIMYLLLTLILVVLIGVVVFIFSFARDAYKEIAPDDPSKGGLVNTGLYAPKENSHPKYFMIVKGRVSSTLLNQVQLKWQVDYKTTNPYCDVTINKFEGVKTYRSETINFISKPDLKGYFSHKIALDKFSPGLCDWQIQEVGYKLIYNDKSYFNFYPQIKFSNFNYQSNSVAGDIWKCGKQCDFNWIKVFNKHDWPLFIKRNYIYKVNVIGG